MQTQKCTQKTVIVFMRLHLGSHTHSQRLYPSHAYQLIQTKACSFKQQHLQIINNSGLNVPVRIIHNIFRMTHWKVTICDADTVPGCVAPMTCVCVVNPDHFCDLNSRRLTCIAPRVAHTHTHTLTCHSVQQGPTGACHCLTHSY